MKISRISLLIIATLLPTQLMAANFFAEMMAMMMRMMLIMSNSMAMSPGNVGNMGFGGPMAPYYSPMQNMGAYPGWTQTPINTNPWASSSTNASNNLTERPLFATPLDGQWVNSLGDKLEFKGELFRLTNNNRATTGRLKIIQNIVVMIPTRASYPLRYRFERRENALALQDTSGNIQFFRKAHLP